MERDRLLELAVASSRTGSARTSRGARRRSATASGRAPARRSRHRGAPSTSRRRPPTISVAAVGLRLVERSDHPAVGTLVDQRTDERARRPTGRRSTAARTRRADPATSVVDDVLVRDHAAQARAPLAGGARGGEHDPAGRELEVGRRRDHRGVVAAELEQAAVRAGPRRGARPRRPSALTRWRSRARRRGCRSAPAPASASAITSWCSPAGAPALRRRRGRARAAHASDVSGVIGEGFQTTLSPHTSATRGVPRPDGGREVERRDHGHDTERVPGLHQPVVGSLGRHRAPVELARQPDREVADVDHLLNLAERLGRDLPGLDRDQLGDVGLVLASSAPKRLTSAPRTGAGTVRQLANAALGRGDRGLDLAAPAAGTSNRSSPVIGERALTRRSGRRRGRRRRSARGCRRARSRSSPVEATDSAVELIRAGTTAATSSGVASAPPARRASRGSSLAIDRVSSRSNSGPKPSIVVAGTPNDAASATKSGCDQVDPERLLAGQHLVEPQHAVAAVLDEHDRQRDRATSTTVASSPHAYMKPPSPITHTVGPAPARHAPSDAGNPNPSVPQPSG